MSITDNIMDKALYKRLVPEDASARLQTFYLSKDYSANKIYLQENETTGLKLSIAPGGRVVVSGSIRSSNSSNCTLYIYVNEEIVFSETKSVTSSTTANFSTFVDITPLSVIKITASGGTQCYLHGCSVRGYIEDIQEMYMTEIE